MYANDYDDYDYDDYGGHTGDPMLDREYERQRSVSDYMVPDPIKKFIVYFHEVISQGNGYEITKLYEQTWPKLTEQYFKSSPSWSVPLSFKTRVERGKVAGIPISSMISSLNFGE